MEALVAVGLAGNIVQFIDFTYKLLHGTASLYHSRSEASPDTEDLEAVTKGLQQICLDLTANKNNNQLGKATSQQQTTLQNLATNCEALAGELLSALEALKAKDPSSKWSCFKAALATTWKESRVRTMQKKLDSYRDLLFAQFGQMDRDSSDLDLGGIMSLLDDLSTSSRQLRTEMTDELHILRTELQKTLRDLKVQLADLNAVKPAMLRASTDVLYWPRVAAMSRTKAVGTTIALALNVLKDLSFEQMKFRHSRVHNAHQNSFGWLLHHGFLAWTKSKECMFWISGKPGSGKSTLMKWLVDNRDISNALSIWAGPQQLVIASYFFWIQGTELQRTQEGLLRALLYDIFRHRPDLIPTVAPDVWQLANSTFSTKQAFTYEWTRPQLDTIFQRLSVFDLTKTRFCFFVDGLDEYHGDHDSLISTLRRLASANIKMCVSSRPWNVFEQSLGQNHNHKLYLQDHNVKDIRQYVEDKLTTRRDYKVQTSDSHIIEITHDIVQRSQGVFLWVFLVVRSLLEGLRNHDRPSQLQTRLQEFPNDLKDFFNHIFESLDPIYKTISAHMFQVALASPTGLNILSYWFLDEEEDHPGVALSMPVKALKSDQFDFRVEEVRVRINGRLKGLLEDHGISPQSVIPQCGNVDFLHRTVRDWLDTSEMQGILTTWQRKDFDVDLAVCKMSLAELKSVCAMPGVGWRYIKSPCDRFLQSARAYEERKKECPWPYIDAFENTMAEHIRLRPLEIPNYPWSRWQCSSFVSVAAKHDLRLFMKARLASKPDRARFSENQKLEILISTPWAPVSPEMMAIILPIGPFITFTKRLQDNYEITIRRLDHDAVVNNLKDVCKFCAFEAVEDGIPASKMLEKALREKLSEDEFDEVRGMVRRANRSPSNALRRLDRAWRRTSLLR